MKKYLKWFISLAAIGSAIGLIIAYLCKGRCSSKCCDDSQNYTEDDDFDLDNDLQPVPDRGYVPLNRTSDVASDSSHEESSKENTADDTSAKESE